MVNYKPAKTFCKYPKQAKKFAFLGHFDTALNMYGAQGRAVLKM
ncbi:hypothetical protein [Ruthenibacterium intestinale]